MTGNDGHTPVLLNREDVQREDYESPLSSMYNRAWDRYRQAEQRRASGETTAPSLEGLTNQERREIEDQLVWGVLQESRENLIRGGQSNDRDERRDTAMSVSFQETGCSPVFTSTFPIDPSMRTTL